MMDLRQDPAALQKALQVALTAIKSEHSIVCPARRQDIPEDESKIDCCEVAVKQTSFAHKAKKTSTDLIPAPTETVELQFRVRTSGKLIKVRLINGKVEYIEPSPCGESLDEDTEEDHPVSVSVRDQGDTVLDAIQSIETRLGNKCNTAFGVYTLIKHVHWAKVKVVEGLSVRLVVEFRTGTLHNVEVNFGIDGNNQIIWPSMNNSTDPCDMFKQSTLDRAILPDIVAMSKMALSAPAAQPERHLSAPAAPPINTFANASSAVEYREHGGGHLAALDEAVPLASMAELHELLHSNTSELPAKYDVRTEHPKCFPTSIVLRQGSCGSCWAFAATGAIGDRHCIANPLSMIDMRSGWRYTLSVQQILSCRRVNGCDGGHAYWVFDDMKQKGMKLTYARDYPYQSRCWQDTHGVTEDWGSFNCYFMNHLSDDDPTKPCPCVADEKRLTQQPRCDRSKQAKGEFTIDKYHRLPKPGALKGYYADQGRWTNLEVELLIANEIYKDGPVYASFAVYEDFQRFVRNRGGNAVYKHSSGELTGHHAVVMVGWGLERGTKFWSLRNSWGPTWGDNGHYRHIRGTNDCGIEGNINIPKVRVVQRVSELKFSHETVSSSSSGWWTVKKTWTMNIKCNAPCKPVFAVLPDIDVAAHFQKDESSSKCCCDKVHFSPGKCMWVPKRELSSSSLFGSGDASCGVYNFGRGRAQTTEFRRTAVQCGDEMFAGNSSSRGMLLEFKNENPKSLQVKIDLTANPSLVNKAHRILVKAQTEWGDIETEHLYMVPISLQSTKGIRPQKLFQISGIDTAIERRDEPYAHRGVTGFDEWKMREKYVLRVIARCSQKCMGSAAFRDLDTSHHPKGKAALSLTPEKSESDTTLIWVANVRDYPAGQQSISVVAQPMDRSQQMDRSAKEITVEIPNVGLGQGGLWLPPVKVTPLTTKVVKKQPDMFQQLWGWGDSNEYRQQVSASCSRACEVTAFKVNYHGGNLDARVHTSADDQVLVSFKLQDGMTGRKTTATLEVSDLNDPPRISKVEFELVMGRNHKLSEQHPKRGGHVRATRV
eukprot:gnl/MRDRNA2_/MRDRNA2_15501_c0_seq2.p1 gnl/MRDRNA2_/MRDRNA2_15501_c0~~gnl/MRDRNA2_/MRDRNA2_15501_c0_seq2.p1  ORF type:complete len:1051 (+),score=157.43 gnl/MRDRNA2_/MRDRNA2_15501_c0_seq2:1-3153(+)